MPRKRNLQKPSSSKRLLKKLEVILEAENYAQLVRFFAEQTKAGVIVDVNTVTSDKYREERTALTWVVERSLLSHLQFLLDYANETGQLAKAQQSTDEAHNPGGLVGQLEEVRLLREYGIPLHHMFGTILFLTLEDFYRNIFLDATRMTRDLVEEIQQDLRQKEPTLVKQLEYIDDEADDAPESAAQRLANDLPILGKLLEIFQADSAIEDERLRLYPSFETPAVRRALDAGLIQNTADLRTVIRSLAVTKTQHSTKL